MVRLLPALLFWSAILWVRWCVWGIVAESKLLVARNVPIDTDFFGPLSSEGNWVSLRQRENFRYSHIYTQPLRKEKVCPIISHSILSANICLITVATIMPLLQLDVVTSSVSICMCNLWASQPKQSNNLDRYVWRASSVWMRFRLQSQKNWKVITLVSSKLFSIFVNIIQIYSRYSPKFLLYYWGISPPDQTFELLFMLHFRWWCKACSTLSGKEKFEGHLQPERRRSCWFADQRSRSNRNNRDCKMFIL